MFKVINACWFLLVSTFPITNKKIREAAAQNEAGGDKKHSFSLTYSITITVLFSVLPDGTLP